MRFEITLEPSTPIPEFLVNRARRKILYAATEGLRRKAWPQGGGECPSRLIASSSVSSRLQNVKRTK